MTMQSSVRPQEGVCAEPTIHSWTLLLDVVSDDVAALQGLLLRFPSLVDSLSARFSEANLNVVLAIGAEYWPILAPDSEPPSGLKSIETNTVGEFALPQTHADFALICRADRLDANYFAVRVMLEWFGDLVIVQDDIQGFRYLDGRDLFGFRIDPDMPHGNLRRELAYVAGHDSLYAGGSYLCLQRVHLNLKRWEQLSVEQQREIMGREKVSGQPWPTALPNHAEKSARGALALWRVQMPLANVQTGGEMVLHWSRDLADIEAYLQQRFGAIANEQETISADPLLAYEQVIKNAVFFAPARNWFERLASKSAGR